MRRLNCTLLVIACIVLSGVSAQPQMLIDLVTTHAASELQADNLREFTSRVNHKTDGQVIINIRENVPPEIKDDDRFSAVARGTAPMASVPMGSAADESIIFGLSTCPFMVKDFEEARLLLAIARPYYEREASKFNQRILYIFPWPPSVIHAMRPIKRYEDLAGLRIRIYEAHGERLMKKVGGYPVHVPFGDVAPALMKGTMDSVLASTTAARTGKYWRVLTDTTRVNFAIPLNMITINLNFWASLTRKQRDTIEKIGREMEERQWKLAE